MAPWLVLAGVLGLAVGSFLTAVIHRIPRDESLLRPGSHCPQCLVAIRPRHRVPVLGWLLLHGRCAGCRAPIGLRYPMVELATSALFVAVTVRFGLSGALAAYLYLAAVAVALAVIDLDVRRLPNAIVLPSYAVGAGLLLPVAAAQADWRPAARGLAGMAALLGLYLALAAIHPGGMGAGDVKLAGLLGLYLGWLGWSSVWVGTLAAFLFGGLAASVLMLTRRATRGTAIPFGPSMLAGAMLAVLAADPLADVLAW